MKHPYRLALTCGILPLVAGVGVLLTWLATRRPWLMSAGVGVIAAGLVLLCAGLWFLRVAARQGAAGAPQPRRSWRRIRVALVLLLLNLPVALACLFVAFWIETTWHVVVVNEGSEPVTALLTYGPECDHELGPIAPGEDEGVRFSIEQDGRLLCRLRTGGEEQEVLVEDYVTGNLGGDARVRVRPDGRIEVEHPFEGR